MYGENINSSNKSVLQENNKQMKKYQNPNFFEIIWTK